MKTCYGLVAFFTALIVIMHSNSGADPPVMPAQDSADKSLDSQYAQVRLELAKANLKRIEAMNRRVARAVSPNVVAQYQNDLALARLRQQAALEGQPDSFAVWIKVAESNWKSAFADWQSAVAANQKQQGTVNQLDVERLRLQSEMYRIGLRRGEALANQSRQTQLEWRLSMLGDEIERVNEAVFRGTPSPGRSPIGLYYYEYSR